MFLLGLLQPLNAALRPHKAAPGQVVTAERVAWEWLHKGVGYTVLLLGVGAVATGLAAAGAGEGWVVVYALYVTGVMIWWFVCERRRLGQDSAGKLTLGVEVMSGVLDVSHNPSAKAVFGESPVKAGQMPVVGTGVTSVRVAYDPWLVGGVRG